MTANKLRHICMVILPCLLCIYLIFLTFVFLKLSKIHDYFKDKLIENKMSFIEEEESDFPTMQHNIKKLIAKYNNEEHISNQHIYGRLTPHVPVFVIFAEKYKSNLDFLLGSLRKVGGIRDALIIFSHSDFDIKVINIIKSINFARVLQIYYPYSMHLYRDEFPGHQRINCTPEMYAETVKLIDNYTISSSINLVCHDPFRNPVLAQKKHFWWWTMNHVFENLSHTKNHKGTFIFLEDDLFLMEDFIYMTLQMKNISKYMFQYGFITLATAGIYPDLSRTKIDGVDVKTWNPKEHSSVLAFDANVWKSIAAHYELFCNFDDYSWSHTLFYLSLHKKDGKFKVISSTMPRAYKTDGFVTVESNKEYTMVDTVSKIVEIQNLNEGLFYPKELEVFIDIPLNDDYYITDYIQNNGSWNDPRDKEMCTNITEHRTKKLSENSTSEYYDDEDE